jgi:hypothetical protein
MTIPDFHKRVHTLCEGELGRSETGPQLMILSAYDELDDFKDKCVVRILTKMDTLGKEDRFKNLTFTPRLTQNANTGNQCPNIGSSTW